MAHPHAPHASTLKRGQIRGANASAILAVLKASAGGSVAGLSTTMQSDMDRLEHTNPENLPHRPCLVLRHDRVADMVSVVVLTTFGSGLRPIEQLNKHFQHFVISVGATRPWPEAQSWTLQPVPDWPKSSKVPVYAVARILRIPRSSLRKRWKSVERPIEGPPKVTYYQCNVRCCAVLERICDEKAVSYMSISSAERLDWDMSYEMCKMDYEMAKLGYQDSVLPSLTGSVAPLPSDLMANHYAVSDLAYGGLYYDHGQQGFPGYCGPPMFFVPECPPLPGPLYRSLAGYATRSYVPAEQYVAIPPRMSGPWHDVTSHRFLPNERGELFHATAALVCNGEYTEGVAPDDQSLATSPYPDTVEPPLLQFELSLEMPAQQPQPPADYPTVEHEHNISSSFHPKSIAAHIRELCLLPDPEPS
ncbi:hypothetical protein AURDEDRAFT_171568 [Auricularia subglabra TFB-10046 SS5]|nr:hypothetical protein AURDEDRAFT_171568 [Auricularia subglabra TFB-10046 SS5]